MADDLNDRIEDALRDPSVHTVDGQTTQDRSIEELIKGEQHLATRGALCGTNRKGGKRSPWNSLRPARVIPPGMARDI
jgi:hypothetical protein